MGRSQAKPTQEPKIAPRMTCPCAPMLNRPARKPTPTPRPAKIRGTAFVRVSVMGRHMRRVELACQSKTDPRSMAT